MRRKIFFLLFLLLLTVLMNVTCGKNDPFAPQPKGLEESPSEESAQSLSKSGRDGVLARRDVKISNVAEKNYDTRFVVPALGAEIRRGFVAANAKVDRKTYRFVNAPGAGSDQ